MSEEKCSYQCCNLERCPGSDRWCILHDPNPEKDARLFEKTLEEKIQREEESDKVDTVNLEAVVFPLEVKWGGRVFKKTVSLVEAKVKVDEETGCKGKVFNKRVSLNVDEETGRSGRVFKKGFSFLGARFLQSVDFTCARFSGPADFSAACFLGGADFVSAHFSSTVNFIRARFSRAANFSRAQFCEATNLFGVQFSQAADFSDAQFSNAAYFTSAQFYEAASFPGARFSGGAYFAWAQFSGASNFSGAQFSEWANFSEAQFSGAASFRHATFHKEVRFRKTTFPSRVEGREVNLSDVTFKEPEKVFFEHVYLSQVSFLYTDMSRVNLTDVTWPRREDPGLGWLPRFKDRIVAVHDHLDLPEQAKVKPDAAPEVNARKGGAERDRNGGTEVRKGKENRFRLVENLYRQLRFNLESRKQYIEAGDFHIGEMEMRRLNPETPRHYRCLLWFYRYGAQYGESYFRPLFYWLVLGLLFFAPLYMAFGFKSWQHKVYWEFCTFDILAWRFEGWLVLVVFIVLLIPLWGYLPLARLPLLLAPLSWLLWQAFFTTNFLRDYGLALVTSLTVPSLPTPDFQPLTVGTALVRLANSLVNLFLIALTLIALRRRFKR